MERESKFDNNLVSVIVITYNSEAFVLETLISIKNQTYKQIELIISDDSSTDNTVSMCKNWINENSERFVSTEVVEFNKNTGVTKNCNRGLSMAKGEWIKIIAGDDLLINTCINDFMIYVSESIEKVNVVIGACLVFINTPSLINLIGIQYDAIFYNSNLTCRDQYLMLQKSNRPHAPGSFIRHSFLLDIGRFDENYTTIEDYPLWWKVTKSGNIIFGLPKPMVYYRLHKKSVFGSQSVKDFDKIVKNSYWLTYHFRRDKIYPELDWISKIVFNQLHLRNVLLKKCGNTHKNISCKILLLIFEIFNMSRIEKILKKRF